jgi:hypothetical protein
VADLRFERRFAMSAVITSLGLARVDEGVAVEPFRAAMHGRSFPS